MADIDVAYGRYGVLCGRYSVADIVCGRYRRFPITSDAPGAVKLRGQDTTGQNAAENPEI